MCVWDYLGELAPER